jgi:putative heme-binding domain-containing protein
MKSSRFPWFAGLAALGLAGQIQLSAAGAAADSSRLAVLGKLVHDPAPRVRLEALRALAKIKSPEAAALALDALNEPMDPTLDYALWLTINDLSEPWIAALQSGAWKTEGREKQLEFGLKAIKPEQASRVLGRLLADHPLGRDGRGPWIELIGSAGTPRELKSLLDQVLAGGFDDAATVRALKSLSDAARLRNVRPAGGQEGIAKVLDSASDSVRVEALKLAGVWKSGGPAFDRIVDLAGATGSSDAARSAALGAVRSIGGAQAIAALSKLSGPEQSPAVRRSAAAALAGLDLGRAVPAVVSVARGIEDEAVATDFWRQVLSVKGAAKAIAEALPASGVPQPAARAGMRVAREGGRNEVELVVALAKSSGLAADTQAFTGQLVRELASKAASQGDPVRGERIYRRADLACTSCHAIGGAGGRVGPDMTSIGASAPADYLVESVLLPNAKIKEGYGTVVVSTRDGSDYSGTLARETAQEIVLRVANGAEQSIAKNDVSKRELGTLSLMPSGLMDPLNEQEQLDLFAFLSRLGKPGEYDASQGGVARRWRLYVLTHTDQQNGLANSMWEKPLTDRMWSPVYSLVSGKLSQSLIQEVTRRSQWVGTIGLYAATELTVAKAGPVTLNLNASAGEVWVDGRKLGGTGRQTTELSAGTHRVIVRIDPKQIPESVKLESDASFVLN